MREVLIKIGIAGIVLFLTTASVHGRLNILDYPGASQTATTGIDGDRIVGGYRDTDDTGVHGFLYVPTEDIYALCIGTKDKLYCKDKVGQTNGADDYFRGDIGANAVSDAISRLNKFRKGIVQEADMFTGKSDIDLAGAIEEFQDMGMGPHDRLLIYIASHGGSVPNTDTSDPDLLDETTCNLGDEFLNIAGKTIATDDELTEILRNTHILGRY